jgi:D-arabinose 1-dehydrogenase
VAVGEGVLERHGRPIDVVQNWAQLTLQNTMLAQKGFERFRGAGVTCICNSSPLGSGLLRLKGVPLGALGDWHPAPLPLRAAAQDAAKWVEAQGESLAALAVRFSLAKAFRASRNGFRVSTIIGVGTMSELEESVSTTEVILGTLPDAVGQNLGGLAKYKLNEDVEGKDMVLSEHVQGMMGTWLGYGFSSAQ